MDILLVDDDLDIIDGILDGVDFDGLGCRCVHVATTGQQAREILESQDIAVMLTDIEMPGGSGLELLEWVRDSGRDIITMFYTSFPYFDYAKKAIELHSFGYFLKPIAYPELQEHLHKALCEAQKMRLSAKDDIWEKKQKLWHEIALTREQRPESLSVSMYPPGVKFVIAAMFFGGGSVQWKRYALRNVLYEMAADLGFTVEALFGIQAETACVVLTEPPKQGKPEELFRRADDFSRKYLGGRTNFYYLSGADLQKAHSEFPRVLACMEDDVCRGQAVCSVNDRIVRKLSYSCPKMSGWGDMVLAGQHAQVEAEICSELDRLAALGELNMPYIKAMRIDLMQTIHARLQQKQISAYDLFSDERFDALREGSLLSVEHMKEYLSYVVRTAGEYIEYTRESGSVAGRIREYIDSHYSEDITRSTLSKVFFLNSDYLGRLFKKETGLSVSGYLQEVRIEEAKRLLSGTSVQINEIAARVGYDNFSYFSHIFREKTGLTPIEYRRGRQ